MDTEVDTVAVCVHLVCLLVLFFFCGINRRSGSLIYRFTFCLLGGGGGGYGGGGGGGNFGGGAW